jgi:hypothetical protein
MNQKVKRQRNLKYFLTFTHTKKVDLWSWIRSETSVFGSGSDQKGPAPDLDPQHCVLG